MVGDLASLRPRSFPGGLCEEEESPIEAALRETWEELGIKPSLIDVLGVLTEVRDSVTVSGLRPHALCMWSTCVCVCVCVCACVCTLQRRTRGRTHVTPVLAHVMQDDIIDHLTINHSEVGTASQCVCQCVEGSLSISR